MNASSANPGNLGEDELQLLVNGTVRNGFISPRPPFSQSEIAWRDDGAQRIMERGVFQGAGVYERTTGADIMLAFDGWVFRYSLATREVRRITTTQPFSKHSPNVWFGQRGGICIAQDGVSPPLIIRGDTATQGTDPSRSVPTGCMMAEGWGRLAVASPGRDRIYIGNHESDPLSAPLDFTEDTQYYKNTRFFEVPRRLGRIMALVFAPALNGTADLGPLTAICERGVIAYDVSIPRDKWAEEDITTTPLPTIGGCSMFSHVVRGNDIVFSDQHGHIQTLRMAVSRNEDTRILAMDQKVWPLYRSENQSLRHHRWSVRHDERVLTTIQPERVIRDGGRVSVRHRGIIALQESPVVPRFPCWDGLWTGIFPVCLLQVGDRCFSVSLDSDGIHRLYEIDRGVGYDATPNLKAVPVIAGMRATSIGLPFLAKPVKNVSFRLSEISGIVNLRGWWETDRGTPSEWFSGLKYTGDQLSFERGKIIDPSTTSERVNPPTPSATTAFDFAPWIGFSGLARLDEVILETKDSKPTPDTNNISCALPVQLPANSTCPIDIYEYDARLAPEITVIPSRPCNIHC